MHHLPIVQRDDGLFEVDLVEPLGPFETRQFAECIAALRTSSHAAARSVGCGGTADTSVNSTREAEHD